MRFRCHNAVGLAARTAGLYALTLALLALPVFSLAAQTVSSKVYVGIDAGPVFATSQPGTRSGTGLGAGVMAGRQLLPQTAAELRLGFDYFGAPPLFISPGGCLGRVPCNPPTPQRVRIVTLTTDALVGGHTDDLAPFVLAGVGARYADSQPDPSYLDPRANTRELRPFAEIGTGLEIPVGVTRMSLELRYQIAVSDPGLPRWTLPARLAIRF
jgi:hypothetical protein